MCNVVSNVFRQHRLDTIVMQYCPSMVDAILYRLYSLWELPLSHEPTLRSNFLIQCWPRYISKPNKIVDYFSVQSCFWTVGQHYKVNFLVQCWLSQIKTTLHSLFFCKNMSVCPWPTLHKYFLVQYCLRHI